ncbi:MAG: hypothetical protein WA666_01100 [Nitrospirota bacterium]
MKFLISATFIILSITLTNVTVACAEEPLQFELTHNNIQNVTISEIKRGTFSEIKQRTFEVAVKLEYPEAREVFRKLTANNIGRKLAVTCKGHVLATAKIREEVDSGGITLGVMDSKAARDLIDLLILEN